MTKTDLDKVIEETVREVTFVPFGATKSLTLTLEEARHIVANPTKSGKLPSDREVSLFLRLCEFRGLNPYVRDAFLLGYDSQAGATFSSVVSHAAMLKRCDAHEHYNGKASGVIVWDKDKKEKIFHPGDVVPKTLDVIGGWCRIFRKDRPDHPEFAETSMSAYNKGFGHWKVDPNWMIVKCSECKAARAAFPNDLGGMETQEEVVARARVDSLDESETVVETNNDDLLEDTADQVDTLFEKGHEDATTA